MKLGHLVDAGMAEIRTGPFGTQLRARDYAADGRPVLNVRNVGLGEVIPKSLEFVDEETATRLAGHILDAGDIVFGRKGAVERHAFIRREFVGALQGSDCIRLRIAKDAPVRAHFVSFALRTQEHQRWMQSYCSHGATMASLNQDILRQIELPVPPLEAQDAAIRVLGSMDDLIENNRRRIELLEGMAKAIYREWFVSFGYPGSEGVEVIHSSVGTMPATWGITRLSEHVRLRRDNVRPDRSPGESFLHYSIPAFDDRRLPVCEPGEAIRSGKYLLDGECVLLSKLNPRFPRVWRVTPPETGPRAVCSTEFLVLDCGLDWPVPFVYAALTSSEFGSRLSELAGGTSTSHQRAKPADVMALALPEPPWALVQRFAEIAAPVLSEADNLVLQIDQLSQLRDLLLPKLVSGQIDVSGLALDAALEATG
jgi:type I restriction enzyme S subunit